MLKTPQLQADTVFPCQAALERARGPQGQGQELGGAKIPLTGPTSTCNTQVPAGARPRAGAGAVAGGTSPPGAVA